MPLQFQNYGAAFTNAPTQREARDRSASILNVGEQISKLQESNALKKEREKREGEEAEESVMNDHCVSIAADGSRTFSF